MQVAHHVYAIFYMYPRLNTIGDYDCATCLGSVLDNPLETPQAQLAYADADDLLLQTFEIFFNEMALGDIPLEWPF